MVLPLTITVVDRKVLLDKQDGLIRNRSQPWIDRLTSHGQVAEDTFMDTEWQFVADETFEGFDSQSEFAQGDGSVSRLSLDCEEGRGALTQRTPSRR